MYFFVCVYVFKSYLLVKVFIKIRKTEGLSLFFHLVWLISFAVFKSYYLFSILVSHRPFFSLFYPPPPPFFSFFRSSFLPDPVFTRVNSYFYSFFFFSPAADENADLLLHFLFHSSFCTLYLFKENLNTNGDFFV